MEDTTMEGLRGRVKTRYLPGETIPDDGVINEMLQTIYDRLLILISTDDMPELGYSIVVDATMKALRLRGYEGSRSETDSDGGSISNTFIDDVLEAYKSDITALKLRAKVINPGGVKFI